MLEREVITTIEVTKVYKSDIPHCVKLDKKALADEQKKIIKKALGADNVVVTNVKEIQLQGLRDQMDDAVVMKKIIERLIFCFPGSFVNLNNEFIAHRRANEYFMLENCKDELDVKCKVLEWFSRGAYKTQPYSTDRKNEEFHEFMLNGINEFLDTEFTEEDMEVIYTYLGNAVHHERTIRFIESGYDMDVLKGGGIE